MQRVLVPLVVPDWGGLHELACRLAEPLASLGWAWNVVLPDEARAAEARLAAAGVAVTRLPMHRIRASSDIRLHAAYVRHIMSESRRIAQLARATGVALIQASGPHQLHGPLAARSAGLPLVWQMHSTGVPKVARMMISPVISRTADVVMTSGNAYLSQDKRLRSLGDRCLVFYPPVDATRFTRQVAKREAMREQLSVGSEVVLTTVGSRTPVKRHDLVVSVARNLAERGHSVRVLIVGGVSPAHAEWYRNNVEEPADALNRSSNSVQISIVDGGSRVDEYLAASDIFIMMSDAEGAPLALAEAMMSGLPAVVTRVGSMVEMVDSDSTAFVIDRGHAHAAAENIVRLIEDRHLLARMGSSGAARARKTFDEQSCAEVHANAYNRALNMASGTRNERGR